MIRIECAERIKVMPGMPAQKQCPFVVVTDDLDEAVAVQEEHRRRRHALK